MELLTIINLLSTMVSMIKCDHKEHELIKGLNKFYGFDHNIFLLDSLADISRYLRTGEILEFTPQSVYVFDRNGGGGITGLDSVNGNNGKSVFLVVVSSDSTFEGNLRLLTEVKKIQRLNIDMKIVFFSPRFKLVDDIRSFFEWCWTVKIVNIFVVFSKNVESSSLDIFGFNPLGTVDVIDLTESQDYENFFLKTNVNFHQQAIIFAYENLMYRNIWPFVIDTLNATAMVGCEAHFEYMLENCSIDVYQDEFVDDIQPIQLYPLYQTAVAIVVPKALPHTELMGYLLAVTSDNIFMFLFITIVATILCLCLARYKNKTEIAIFKSVADVLSILINDNDAIVYQNLSFVEAAIILPLTFAGLIIENDVLSRLQSHLTRPFLQPQIRTIEDVYRSPFPVYTFHEKISELVIEELETIFPRGDWNKRLRAPESVPDFIKEHIALFDKSVCFVSEVPFANGLLTVQKSFSIDGYYLTSTRLLRKFGTYKMDPDFPFMERINDIIGRLHCGGFLVYEEEKLDKIFINFFTKFTVYKNHNIVQQDEKFPIPLLIWYCYMMSIIAFITEIAWDKCDLQKMFRKFGSACRNKLVNLLICSRH